jgi:glyceraldehyde-3-phosphate dehydrogenase/erythrose-4-phosphate dehydrogenase
MSWYDNEWGYANQMVREAISMTVGDDLGVASRA